MAWTESTEGRNVNNTETLALDGTTKVNGAWLKAPKGATLMCTIASAHTEDITVTIDIEGSYKQVPAATSSTAGGLNFTSLTHTEEEAVKDFIVFHQDENSSSDEAPNPITATIPPMGYDYIRFTQDGSGASTANVVYDVWYNLPVQNTNTVGGIGADPS